MRIKRKSKTMLGIIGKLKIGEKRLSKNGKEYPVSLDYFVAKSKIKSIEDQFKAIYDKSSLLPVCFASDDDDFNIIHRYEIRNKSGKLYSYGDGENFYISSNSDDQPFTLYEHKDIIKKNADIETFMNKVKDHISNADFSAEWRESLTMRVIVPKIQVLGVWELTTRASKTSIDQILSSYDMTKIVNGGTIQMIPFLLNVVKVKNDRALAQSRVYPVLSLNSLMNEKAQKSLIDSEIKLLE